jgi:hypothetical protein
MSLKLKTLGSYTAEQSTDTTLYNIVANVVVSSWPKVFATRSSSLALYDHWLSTPSHLKACIYGTHRGSGTKRQGQRFW